MFRCSWMILKDVFFSFSILDHSVFAFCLMGFDCINHINHIDHIHHIHLSHIIYMDPTCSSMSDWPAMKFKHCQNKCHNKVKNALQVEDPLMLLSSFIALIQKNPRNNESFEPYTQNLYVRRVLSGEFVQAPRPTIFLGNLVTRVGRHPVTVDEKHRGESPFAERCWAITWY